MQPTQPSTPLSSAGRLRRLLAQDGTVAVPGGGTPLEALCAAAAGFDSFYVSGYAVAAWRHGLPDIGLTALSDITAAVSAIRSVSDLAIVVDADTGYGDAAAVCTTVSRLERAGAAAVQVEDQIWPKRCGHMAGKEVIPAADMARKVAAAVGARELPDTLIIARTDALAPLGVHEAIERGRRYADMGADAVFVDAPESVEHLRLIAAGIDCPLVVNMTESGRTPILPLADLSELGFAMAIYPTAALRLSAALITALYQQLASSGATESLAGQMMSLDAMNEALGLGALQARETSALQAAGRSAPAAASGQ
ncbi:MAG TPA: isocitrate lyase/phosphoenolpyruvate mutase family protein [Actinomycetales bacterium]|jgi:methylisocitrate lyase